MADSVTFTYPWKHAAMYGQQTRTSVLTRAAAEQLADWFWSRHGRWEGPWSRKAGDTSSGTWQRGDYIWRGEPGFPADEGAWMFDVDAVLDERRAKVHDECIRSSIDLLVCDEAVRQWLRTEYAAHPTKFRHPPQEASTVMHSLASLARRSTERRSAYEPKPGCNARLNLRGAVHAYSWMDAYADYGRYVVPVKVLGPIDEDVCRSNLLAFTQAIRTTNGLAGYGSSWDATLERVGDQWVAVFTSRSSIAD